MGGPIAVVGGGLSGLTAAWKLARQGHDVVVLEASAQPGGAMHSEHVDGMLVEHGPQAILPSATAVGELVEALGLSDVVVESSPAARRRYLLRDGRLRAFPGAAVGFWDAVGLLAEPLRPRADDPEETVHAFLARRVGRGIADRLADPLVAGLCGGDPHRLEVRSVLPDLARLESEWGSLLWGALRRPRPPGIRSRSYTFRDGLGVLPTALAAALGPRLRPATPVTAVRRQGAGLRVEVPGEALDVERVILAIPAASAAFLGLPALARFEATRLAVVHLAYNPADVPAHDGFGWLAHSTETREVLGVIWVSSIFPTHAPGKALFRVLVGGERDPSAAEASDDTLADRSRRILADVQRIEAHPLAVHVARPPAIPQYRPGHALAVRALQDALPGLSFLGWSYTGLGVAACTRAALDLATGGHPSP